MNVEFTNLADVTDKQFGHMRREFDDAGASLVTLVLLPTGGMHVLSPMEPAWTRHFLLEAGCHMPGVSGH
jgi:hypothetical protein